MIDADALEIPLIELVDAIFNLDGMMPTKTMELIYIGEFLEGAIWLRRIPTELTLKTNLCHDLFCNFLDRDFLAGADIDVAVANLLDAITIVDEIRIVDNILEVNIKKAMN